MDICGFLSISRFFQRTSMRSTAPVKKGEKAGTVSYYLADEKIAENVVVTERAVEKRTWEKCMKIVTAKFLTLESLVWYVKYV